VIHFAGLQDGSITDDEATCQWPGGRGDLRTLLTLAAVRGAITRSEAGRIAEQAGAGSGRWTWADLCRIAGLSLEPPLRQFHAWMQRRAAIRYAASADARKAVGLAVAGLLDAPFVPMVPWPRLAPGLASRDEGAGCGELPARLLTLALYCAHWPGRWHRYVFSRTGYAVGDLHPGELPDEVARRWLTPGDTLLSSGEQARRVLVRAAVRDPCSPAWPVTRRDAEALASGLAAAVPPFPPHDPRGLARIWEVPEADLGVTALDRGFDSPESALRYAGSQGA
jgi:hypothetical protein